MNEQKAILGSILFLILFYLDDDKKCKRVRKKVLRSIKKQLAKYRESISIVRYNELVYIASGINERALSKMTLRGSDGHLINTIDPANFVKLLIEELPLDMAIFEISNMDTVDMLKCYENVSLAFSTKMFVNRVVKEYKEVVANM